MKNKYIIIATVFIIGLLCFPPSSFAGRQHSIGMDLIRLVDQAQAEGMFNIYYQCSLTRNTAVTAGFSAGQDVTIAEAGYKYYLGKYFDSAYGQVGFSIGDYDGETETGLTVSAGYEKSLARHVVMSIAIEMTAGTMDHPGTKDRDPIFRPILGLIFAF